MGEKIIGKVRLDALCVASLTFDLNCGPKVKHSRCKKLKQGKKALLFFFINMIQLQFLKGYSVASGVEP